jgi:hypothetical protein
MESLTLKKEALINRLVSLGLEDVRDPELFSVDKKTSGKHC